MKIEWIECNQSCSSDKNWEDILPIRIRKSYIVITEIFYSVSRQCYLIMITLKNCRIYTIRTKFQSREKAENWIKFVIEDKKEYLNKI